MDLLVSSRTRSQNQDRPKTYIIELCLKAKSDKSEMDINLECISNVISFYKTMAPVCPRMCACLAYYRVKDKVEFADGYKLCDIDVKEIGRILDKL